MFVLTMRFVDSGEILTTNPTTFTRCLRKAVHFAMLGTLDGAYGDTHFAIVPLENNRSIRDFYGYVVR